MTGRETFAKKIFVVIFTIGIYWIISISMVFINKYLLSSKELKFDAPLFVTWYQCLTSLGICFLFAFASSLMPCIFNFPSYKIDLDLSKKIIPLSLMFVGMITFNNLCLKYVSVSFYMIIRSLSTVFNVVLTFLFISQTISIKVLICCSIIIFGFLLGIGQEKGLGGLSPYGFASGVIASAFVALNAIYTKKSLSFVNNNIWKLTMYNNVNACIIFIPTILYFGEYNRIVDFHKIFDFYFWFAMTLSGILGFSMSYVTSLQIQVTSPLTHNISGTAKAYAQTVIAVFYYNESKPILWWLSNILVLAGATFYSHVRTQEMKELHNVDLASSNKEQNDISKEKDSKKQNKV